MQRHVLENLASVVLQNRSKTIGPIYDLRGKDVNAQIASLIVKDLVVKRSGELSLQGGS
jgi:hypothetical protein